MPDRREHRGPHPEDAELFAVAKVSTLEAAVCDLSWLLTRGYSDTAATKVVGDRYQLTRRQRVAVRRCACTDAQRTQRGTSRVAMSALAGEHVAVDGFNVLLTVEAALAGGVILGARDGCRRDLASMHGTWKRVAETTVAVGLVLDALAAVDPAAVTFILDRPVANSGRLAAVIRAAAESRLPACRVECPTPPTGSCSRAARWWPPPTVPSSTALRSGSTCPARSSIGSRRRLGAWIWGCEWLRRQLGWRPRAPGLAACQPMPMIPPSP